MEVLAAVKEALEDYTKMATKYKMATGSPSNSPKAASQQLDLEAERESLKVKAKTVSEAIHFPRKLQFNLLDQKRLEALLVDLTRWDDCLDKLLPCRERTLLAKGLPSQVLSQTEAAPMLIPAQWNHSSEGSHSATDDPYGAARETANAEVSIPSDIGLQHHSLAMTADVRHMCLDFAFAAENEVTPEAPSMKIDNAHIKLLTEPKMKAADRVWPRTLAYHIPSSGSRDPAEPATFTPVMVEWRPTGAQSSQSIMTDEELARRRDHVARLLARTSEIDSGDDYRVLNCLGYILHVGHCDGDEEALVGYVYHFPPWASTSSVPVSLFELLTTSYNSTSTLDVPALDERFVLARTLAGAVYQLQCSQWLHRKLGNRNILFFGDAASGSVALARPFIAGFQYSRPDDQYYRGQRSEGINKGPSLADSIKNQDFAYITPSHFDRRGRRFKRSDDVYTFGVLLFEIAFWEPIQIFEGGGSPRKISDKIEEIAKNELGSEMGNRYKQVVMECMYGLGKIKAQDGTPSLNSDEDPEIGLESEFFWRVLRELGKYKV